MDLLAAPLESVRAACARVASSSRHVAIDRDRLEAWTSSLPVPEIGAPDPEPLPSSLGSDPEVLAAYVLSLDAVNFGSGWFPALRKRPGLSGYRTIEAGLSDHFARFGPLRPADLAAAEPARCAEIFGQTLGSAPIAELMGLFAGAWRDLGAWVVRVHGGSFARAARAGGGSLEAIVRDLLDMPLYRDVASYAGEPVPLLKRAQITAFDLYRALPAEFASCRDLDRLTIFADNLVPHVLRLDGVLRFEPALVARIEREEPIAWGSPEEVEIRACAVHACEQAVAALRRRGASVCAAELDLWLWLRGGGASYKARPRHRCRCPYY